MGKFNRGGGSGGFGGGSRGGFRGGDRGRRPSFQKKSWGGDRGSDRSSDRQMFSAVCNECKKNCEVPFRPSGEKPVYCSDCFRKEENGGGGREQRGSFGGGRDRERSFDRGSERPSFAKLASADNEGLKKQLSEMNSKLDRLINAIEGMSKTKFSAPVASPKVEAKSEAKVFKKPEVKTESLSKVSKKEVSKKSGGKVNSKKK